MAVPPPKNVTGAKASERNEASCTFAPTCIHEVSVHCHRTALAAAIRPEEP